MTVVNSELVIDSAAPDVNDSIVGRGLFAANIDSVSRGNREWSRKMQVVNLNIFRNSFLKKKDRSDPEVIKEGRRANFQLIPSEIGLSPTSCASQMGHSIPHQISPEIGVNSDSLWSLT